MAVINKLITFIGKDKTMMLTGKQIDELMGKMNIAPAEDWWDLHDFICQGRLIAGQKLTALWKKDGRVIGQIRRNTNNVYGAAASTIDITDVSFKIICNNENCAICTKIAERLAI